MDIHSNVRESPGAAVKLCLGDLLVMGSNQFFIYIVTNHYHIDPYVADPCVRKRFDCYCCICLTY